VVHLTKVATETLLACLANGGLDVDLAVRCALLHDCVEDAGVGVDEVARVFGDAVAQGVAALTKDASLPKEHAMQDSLARIARQPREVWVVKLADRITNLEPPPSHWSVDKRRRYRQEARDILAHLGGASPTLEARLRAKIEAYAAYC
jgi:(p)ppGpp synthase/HD superfamily hydrolase